MSMKIPEASYQDTDASSSSAYDDELTNVSSLSSSSIMMLPDEDTTLLADTTSLCENCRSVFASAWLFLVLTGILGNGLVIFTIIRYRKLNNVTQCYLFHLAITDISFIVSNVPLTTYVYLYESWKFGRLACKAYHYLSFVTVCATCLTLMMMTIDRYFYVCNSRKSSWRSPIYVLFVSILIWIVSFLLSVPNMLSYDIKMQQYVKDGYEGIEYSLECVQVRQFLSAFSQWYSMIVSYFIPSAVLIVSYIKILSFMSLRAKNLAKLSAFNGRVSMIRKRRVTKTVILLTMTFIILWLPVHSIGIWYRLDANFPQHYAIYVLKMIAHTMAYSNASINPIIYAFSNESVRTGLVNLLVWTRCYRGGRVVRGNRCAADDVLSNNNHHNNNNRNANTTNAGTPDYAYNSRRRLDSGEQSRAQRLSSRTPMVTAAAPINDEHGLLE